MDIYSSNKVKQIEANANANGLSYLKMMHRAGLTCAKAIFKMLKCKKKSIAVVCGKGKNGGDGFVAAKALSRFGCDVSVILACGQPVAADAVTMFKKLEDTPVFSYPDDEAINAVNCADVIVDAVFGFGFKGKVDESTAELIRLINSVNAKVVAIDLPSGVECDTAAVNGECINADVTLAISCKKAAHVLEPACSYCGKIKIIDIGLDCTSVSPEFFVKEKAEITLKHRERNSHKGDYGKVLNICGSKKYPGAAVLSAEGAVKCGAGLVTCAFPNEAYAGIASKLTEPIMMPLPCCTDGFFSRASIEPLIEQAEKSDAVLIGCGLGVTLATASVFEEVVAACTKPMVIDADGINLLGMNINIQEAVKNKAVVTPHSGELARFLGLSAEQVNANRLPLAKAFAKKYGVVTVLKGANTVVSDGERVYINRTGNAGMAKGGSGDLLSGMIVSLLAQGYSRFDAAVTAVFLHGAAGDKAAEELSLSGMTPTDMVKILPKLLSEYEL